MSLEATAEVLHDVTTCPSSTSPKATIQNSLQLPENTNATTQDNNESERPELDYQQSAKPMNDNENQGESPSNSKDNSEINKMQELIVGEIAYTETDITINDTIDSKGNLTLGDVSQGVSGMHPLETSRVISEPIEGGAVPESTMTTSISTSSTSSNKLPHTNTDEETRWAKKNKLKSCII